MLKPSYDVFILRMMNPESPSHAYLGRSPSWLKNLELEKFNRKLVRSIHNNKTINIAYYINHIEDCQKTYNAIKKYYSINKGYKIKNNKKLESINYVNKNHIILALICYLKKDESEIQQRTIFKKLDDSWYSRRSKI